MEKHHGIIIERVARRANLSLSELSKLMGVNRRSMYNWFTLPKIKPEVIFRLGQALQHDFSREFPEFFSSEDFRTTGKLSNEFKDGGVATCPTEGDFWKDKYISLLEKINKAKATKNNVSA